MNLPTKLIHMKTCGKCFRSLPVEAHGCPTSPQPPRPQIVQPFQKCSGQLEFNMNKLINTTFSRIFMKHMFFEYSQCPWFHISNPLKNNNGIHHRSTSVDPSVSQVCLDLNSSNLGVVLWLEQVSGKYRPYPRKSWLTLWDDDWDG